MANQNHYQLLGVATNASRSAIRTAYRKALRRHHPDANAGNREGEAMLRQVIAAGRVLCDQRQRAAYDEDIKAKEAHTNQQNRPQKTFGPYARILLGCGRVLSQSKKIWQKFFTAEWAKATELRAAQQREPESPMFTVYLRRAIQRKNTRQYQKGKDGIFRREKKGPQKQQKDWPKKTALWLLLGIISWPI